MAKKKEKVALRDLKEIVNENSSRYITMSDYLEAINNKSKNVKCLKKLNGNYFRSNDDVKLKNINYVILSVPPRLVKHIKKIVPCDLIKVKPTVKMKNVNGDKLIGLLIPYCVFEALFLITKFRDEKFSNILEYISKIDTKCISFVKDINKRHKNEVYLFFK